MFEVTKIYLNVYIQNSIFTQELSNWGKPLSSTSQSLVHHWYANYVSFHTINNYYWELQWSSALEALTVFVCRHFDKIFYIQGLLSEVEVKYKMSECYLHMKEYREATTIVSEKIINILFL